MQYFPLFFQLKDQPCLVVGGGEVATRKIELLLRAGSRITVVAPDICQNILQLSLQHPLTIEKRKFHRDDIRTMRLIISATNDEVINTEVALAANTANIPVNVVDNPKLCSFIFPSIVDRSPLTIAIGSDGISPVLSRLVRAKIETVIPASFAQLAQFAGQFRNQVKQRIPNTNGRRIFWEQVLQGPIAEQVQSGNKQSAERQLTALLDSSDQLQRIGEVYLIGAGPGDPDLLTFRALRLMQQADVIVYDRLVSPAILDLARRDAERIYVGKERNHHSVPQESINDLLATLALAGKRVARLKGGDPFIFGRGGEEIETLIKHDIAFQVVPGITAASGCSSYAGIPLTHRDHAQSCTFVTGHLKDGSINLNWQQLAAPNQTIVIYMGLLNLGVICQSLIEHGCARDHPIAVIQQGTTANQRVIIGRLSDINEKVESANLKAPTLIIVGSVVNLHENLQWFNTEDNKNSIQTSLSH